MRITPLVITLNEAPNIGRCLDNLTWAAEVVVVDSFSSDETMDILRSYEHVRVFQREFDSFAEQCNYGLRQIHTQWVLSLDADYMVPTAFVEELQELSCPDSVRGFRAGFTYYSLGRPLRASLYPPRVVLFRRDHGYYENDGHGHRLHVDGEVQGLSSRLLHDDRKPPDRWLANQLGYAEMEARKLMSEATQQLGLADRLRRKVILAPCLVPFYTLFIKGLILDGWPGWYYALQRTVSEMVLSLSLLEKKMK